MKVGLVGLGSIGRRHLGNLLDLGCDVVAFDVSADARAKAEASYPHARYVDSLLFAGLDALVIATPIGNHLRWVEEAVARKIPFFVEKALGTLEQLPRWREIAAMDLPVNQVGYNLRFNANAVAMKAGRERAEVGIFHCGCDMGTWPGRGYGAPLLEMSHEIDLALWFGAPPSNVGGWAEGSEAEITFGPYVDRWRVYLNGGASAYGRWWYVDGVESAFAAPGELGEAMYRGEIFAFLSSVTMHQPMSNAATLADGLKVLEVVAQLEQVAA